MPAISVWTADLQHHLLRQEAVNSGRPAIEAEAISASTPEIGISFTSPPSLRMSRVPGLVVDDAGAHEQRRLEGRVVEDVEHGDDDAERRAEASSIVIMPRWLTVEFKKGVAARGAPPPPFFLGERFFFFEVVLEDRDEGRDRHRGEADRRDDEETDVGPRQRRPEAREQGKQPAFTMVAECR